MKSRIAIMLLVVWSFYQISGSHFFGLFQKKAISVENHYTSAVIEVPSTSAVASVEQMVAPIYLKLLQEAENRSAADFSVSHQYGDRGVVIGPTAGELRHTIKAMQNARRIRNILGPNEKDIRVALITTQEHVDLLKTCTSEPEQTRNEAVTSEACRLWANGTLFHDIVTSREDVPWTNDAHANLQQGTSRYWMESLGGILAAPFTETLILDSDSYPCPGFTKMFSMFQPFSNKLWAMPSRAPVDLVTGLDQYPDQHHPNQYPLTGLDSGIHADFEFMADRNLGTHMWNFRNPHTHTFAHFILLVTEHIYNNVATPENQVVGEQTPFKTALYLYKRLRPAFHEEFFPTHTSCRTYPNQSYAGIDGALNGMYPPQEDGKICGDCRCTPCLINHCASTHFVTVNGLHGWENDQFITDKANSLRRV
jgi:hypothetical protein